MVKKIFAWYPIRELMQSAGAKMIGRDAVAEMIDLLEKRARKVTGVALEVMRNSNRKKLSKEDVEMALNL